MGILKSSFQFVIGTVAGVYLAQNYDVPNVRKLARAALLIADHIDQNYRNKNPPNQRSEDD